MSVSIKEEEEEEGLEAERGTGTGANVPLLQEEDGPAKAKEIVRLVCIMSCTCVVWCTTVIYSLHATLRQTNK